MSIGCNINGDDKVENEDEREEEEAEEEEDSGGKAVVSDVFRRKYIFDKRDKCVLFSVEYAD